MKYLGYILISILIFSLAACGTATLDELQDAQDANVSTEQNSTETTELDTPETGDTASTNSAYNGVFIADSASFEDGLTSMDLDAPPDTTGDDDPVIIFDPQLVIDPCDISSQTPSNPISRAQGDPEELDCE